MSYLLFLGVHHFYFFFEFEFVLKMKYVIVLRCRDDNHASASVADKINIFRPDRVFMVIF